MGKYASAELKEMALEVVKDFNVSGERSFQLLLTVSVMIDMDPEVVFEKIKEFARWQN